MTTSGDGGANAPGGPAGPIGDDRSSGLALCLGAAAGATGVALGAFGAHALRQRLDPGLLEIYRTGVLYQVLHALALLAVAALGPRLRRPRLTALLFAFGILIFSGSLYVLALSGVRIWGAVTPFGGVALIGGWLSMVLFSRRARPQA